MNSQHVLVVEDDHNLRTALSDTLGLAGYKTCVAESAEQAMTICARHNFDAVVSDINLPGDDGYTLMTRVHKNNPDLPVILMTGYADTEKAVAAMKAGARDYLVKPFPPARLLRQLKSVTPATAKNNWVAEDPASLQIKKMATRVAGSDATVLITGESGTGKEVLARFIHSHSSRFPNPFVAVNCAALPDTMLESILFGHEKGAFTGATSRQTGKFEQANNGTLFLDEIAEMPLPQQAKLLRVIQEREVERLGSHTPISVNVRILAATNRDLADEVRAGNFREDLYYRLNVIPLHIPALRERPGDIQPIARHLLKAHASTRQSGPEKFSPDAETSLLQYHWPGNIRELDNVVQRACVMSAGNQIEATDLLLPVSLATRQQNKNEETNPEPVSFDDLPVNSRKKAEFKVIFETLAKHHGHRGDAAAELGITTRMLRYKLARMRELGIET
ncbi:sigma-54 dependent transcriptional regulator [Sansalvadorimonas sp. 2012CJ34-2]|uniref:Sigma-54 dependent transcriptional regulator n=1 Tax=Parendozoicomonas callyspongiae TaxID=2942213 RepID=A0ABT0PFU5_9GAMM|nr:sigma-54 dependent transcriptional regulator [Sansalvadorimonas sp. 2012CJ34-2]MCL6270126.1 sigma-54 dependent transcriptional regulator [Sansalvadorimonas sp. 2012CJ34-2]